MAFFGRLSCHFCGKRSKCFKGTTEFQCTNCEAFNFFDPKGNVVDTPASVITATQRARNRHTKPFQTFTRPLTSELNHQNDQTFCAKCINNQRMYMESLSNYLPDEDHPRYQEYEDALPKFKAQLEQRYPQVCKKCAAKAQEKIFRADYYGMSQQAAVVMSRTRAREGRSRIGQRDDWGKWGARVILRTVGMFAFASLLVQAAWHTYGILITIFALAPFDELESAAFVFEPTLRQCAEQAVLLRFDLSCYQQLSKISRTALLVNLCLVWYNPGLKRWYDHTHRMEAVYGQKEHFYIQSILLIIRFIAWYMLSDSSATASLSTQQLLAAHGFMIFFMLVAYWMGKRPIRSEIWKIRGSIMPRPSEVDIFGAIAGPADEDYTRQASSKPPLQLFAKDERPFQIENLAPKALNTRGYSKLDLPSMPPPSPPDSLSDSEHGEAMDVDWQPSGTSNMPGVPIDRTWRPKYYGTKQPLVRSTYNFGMAQPSGWGPMRNEIFGIEDKTRAEEERERQEEEERAKLRYEPPVEKSPFRGRLPPAPMSVERRLRNPPTQVQFKKTPLSKQQDFMKQMRDSFENGKEFNVKKPESSNKHVKFQDQQMSMHDDDDDDFSPAKSRTRGNLDLYDSGWRLPSDYAQQSTGLEDLFAGKSFSIADEPSINIAPDQRRAGRLPWGWILGVGMPVILVVIGWNVKSIRREVCLWLVRKLEERGWVPLDVA